MNFFVPSNSGEAYIQLDQLRQCRNVRGTFEWEGRDVYLGLVHRLDRPVGGIMVFAKTSKCASRLSEQIRTKKFKKVYNAVCVGKIDDSGKLVDYLLKDRKKNIVIIKDTTNIRRGKRK